jgi:hypothetical protein
MTYAASYTFSFGDYRTLVAAVQSRLGLKRWTMHLVLAGLIVAAALVGTLGGIVNTGRWPSPRTLTLNAGITLTLASIMVALYEGLLQIPALHRKAYARLTVADKPISYVIDDGGIAWSRDGMQGRFDWSTVQWFAEAPHGVVLLIGAQEGTVLPARGFQSQSAYQEALAFLKSRLSPDVPVTAI